MRSAPPWYASRTVLWLVIAILLASAIPNALHWPMVVGMLSWGTVLRIVAGVLMALRTEQRQEDQQHGRNPDDQGRDHWRR
jgi:hypothetical protein